MVPRRCWEQTLVRWVVEYVHKSLSPARFDAFPSTAAMRDFYSKENDWIPTWGSLDDRSMIV